MMSFSPGAFAMIVAVVLGLSALFIVIGWLLLRGGGQRRRSNVTPVTGAVIKPPAIFEEIETAAIKQLARRPAAYEHLKNGLFQDALAAIDRADDGFELSVAYLHQRLNDIHRAITVCERSLKRRPGQTLLRAFYAQLLLAAGLAIPAEVQIRLLLSNHPEEKIRFMLEPLSRSILLLPEEAAVCEHFFRWLQPGLSSDYRGAPTPHASGAATHQIMMYRKRLKELEDELNQLRRRDFR